MPHFMISAAHKSSGKTTVSIGLLAALRERGRVVQPFKKGPDYIDPLWLSAASGRSCINLDLYTQGRDEIRREFQRHLAGSDLALIEGNKGLYDGLDLDGSNSNAAVAALLGAPVVLVLDTRGQTRGVAPLILGYQAFDPSIRIAGVILNKVGGKRHESKLRAVIEHYTDVRVLGAVHLDPELNIEERHLGLIPSNEEYQAEALIQRLGRTMGEEVDLHLLEEIAGLAVDLPASASGPVLPGGAPVRIGYPSDQAFGFYYPGDLESMQLQGAELVPFDALHDEALPPVDGLFLGGGFPEAVMEGLEANRPLRQAIRAFIEGGGPAYAECGGLMYLARSITWQGQTREMVGAIPGDVQMHEQPQGRGYVRLRETGAGPWPTADTSREIAAHEFHYSSLEGLPPESRFAYEVLRGHGIDGRNDGLVYKNLLASYTHLRAVDGHQWTARFLAHVRRVREQG